MSLMLISISSTDEPAMISNDGNIFSPNVNLDRPVVEPAIA